MFNAFVAKLLAPVTASAINAPATPGYDASKIAASPKKVRSNYIEIKRIAQLKAEARSYEHGFGVGVDMKRAVSLYKEGANLGGAYAIYKLAGFYADGTILPLNREMAVLWYKKGMRLFPQEPVFSGKLADLLADRNPLSENGTVVGIFDLIGR